MKPAPPVMNLRGYTGVVPGTMGDRDRIPDVKEQDEI
jgi:hypothetical protein